MSIRKGNVRYYPIIKTGDAELRALEHLTLDERLKFIPIIELTRGRKSRTDTEGNISKRIEKIKPLFKECPFFIDLTNDERLSNSEIDALKRHDNDYKKWVEFCKDLQEFFPQIYPVLQIQKEDNQSYDVYLNEIKNQIDFFSNNFDAFLFRSQGNNETVRLIADIYNLGLNESVLERVFYLVDSSYIRDSVSGIDNVQTFIDVLRKKIGIKNIIVSSTSFPSNISERFENKSSKLQLVFEEKNFFNKVQEAFNFPLLYSDYASINPIRNDVEMARGWIPRIDLPYGQNLYCARKRREQSSYQFRYVEVAQSIVQEDAYKKNYELFPNCWGLQEIEKASKGNLTSSSPNFWISVRMNIFINNVINGGYL